MDEYEFVMDLGAGSFGLARLMRNKTTKEMVAVKFIERGTKINESVTREIINHRSLRHPSIIRLKEVVLTPTHLAIVMEYAAGGELFERTTNVGRFSEDEARYFFQQLITGVSYCHYMQISHGDLKLANTLLDGSPAPRLKICDFGCSSSYLLHSKPNSIAGTLRYIAPEVLSGTEYDGKLADVWSCGVTLYVMLIGAYPFEDAREPENFEKTTQRILGAKYEIPTHVRMSEECRHLLSRIFVTPARRRITIQEIKNCPWFLKNLPRELTDAHQAIYYSRDSPFHHQSVQSIMEIVEEARKPAMNPPQASSSSGRLGWEEGENNDDQEEYVELEVEEEDEYEEEEDEYDKTLKEAYESTSLSVFGAVRSAEWSLMLNKFDCDHTDSSPSHELAATQFDQSMSDLRLAERSLDTNKLHSYHSNSEASQSVSYAKKATSSKLLDSSMYVRSPERSIKSDVLDFHHSHPPASQSASFAGNPTNSKLSYSSISDVRLPEKSIKSNVSHPSKPSANYKQSDSKSWTKVTRLRPLMSDVRPAEKSIVLNQLHPHHIDPSASKLQTEGLTKGSIDSKSLDFGDSAQIGSSDLSIYDVLSAERSLIM